MKTRIDWLKVGAQYHATEELKTRLLGIADRMEWLKVPTPDEPALQLPMMQGMAITEVIKQIRIPNVSHVGHSSEMAPFGFCGVRGHYSKGEAAQVEAFFTDSGDMLTMLFCRVTIREEVAVHA